MRGKPRFDICSHGLRRKRLARAAVLCLLDCSAPCGRIHTAVRAVPPYPLRESCLGCSFIQQNHLQNHVTLSGTSYKGLSHRSGGTAPCYFVFTFSAAGKALLPLTLQFFRFFLVRFRLFRFPHIAVCIGAISIV